MLPTEAMLTGSKKIPVPTMFTRTNTVAIARPIFFLAITGSVFQSHPKLARQKLIKFYFSTSSL
jgi:hypothetical protein